MCPPGARWRRRSAAAAGLKRGVLWSARDQSVDVIETDCEHHAIDQDEQYEGRGHGIGRERRGRFGGSQHSVGHPGLPSGFGDDPARDHRDKAHPPGILRRPEIPTRVEQTAAPPQPYAGQPGQDHDHADADHGAECEERRRDRRAVARRHALQTGKQSIPAMSEEKRSAMRDRHCKTVRLRRLVGPREQHELARGVTIPVRLDRRDLQRLMRESVEAVLVADEELQRRDNGSETDGHAHHGAAVLKMSAGEDVTRPDGKHHERHRQVRRRHHMREAVWKAWIEHDGEPIDRVGDTVAHLISGRRLHPAVGRQDPERRERRADRDGDGRERMQPRWHPVPTEQHDPEKCRLEEEGNQDLVADHRPDDVADYGREPAPIGAELVRQDNSRHHAQGKGDGEDLGPELGQEPIALPSRAHPHDAQRRDIRR